MHDVVRFTGRGAVVAIAAGAAVVALAVVLLTAGGAAPAGAAAKAPIVIGDMCDCTGSQASTAAGWAPALEVWKKWVNAHGGIDGHQVQIIEKDTKSDPTTTLTTAKALLADKKLIALVPGETQAALLAPAVTAAKAPVVGGLGVDALSFSNQYVFPVSTTPTNLAGVLAAIGARSVKTNTAAELYCAEVAACKQNEPLFARGVTATKGKLAYTAAISAAAPDYTAQCLAAKSAGATYMWIADAATIISRVATSCAQNGYKPQYIIANYDQSFLGVPALNGSKYAFGDALFNSAAASQFQAAVRKYAPGLPKNTGWGQYSFQAWLSGQELARAITLAKPKGGTVTRADVFRGLYAMKNDTLGGGAPKLTFHKGKPASIACGFAGQIRNGKLIGLAGAIC